MNYQFNDFQLDTENFTLMCKDKLIEVEPQVFNLIVYLIENKSRVVNRDDLLKYIWQGRIVLDATLNNHIKSARNVLGDDGNSQKVIKTLHSRGYQFVAQVNSDQDHSIDSRKPFHKKPLILFSTMIILAGIFYVILNNSNITHSQSNIINKKSIAVLAFLDMSPEQNHEYFSDGMSEEILNKLAKIPDLRVISRTSSFFFKKKNDTIKEIGKQLNVSHVLEGSVRKQKDKVRITVQLIDIKTAAHLWSETYDKTMNDIFKVQDDIAEAVSKKLKLSLLSKSIKKNIAHKDAYNIFLQAKHLIQKSTSDDSIAAELLLKKSIAFDPNYAPSWQQLGAIIFKLTFNYGMRSINDGIKTSTYSINKAIELNPDFAPSYATLAQIQSQERKFSEAKSSISKALELDNNNSYIYAVAASTAMHAGDFNLALTYRQKISQIDPKYFRNYYGIGLINYRMNKLESAYSAFETYESVNPDVNILHYLMCSVLLAQSKPQEALEQAKKETNSFWRHYAMTMALYATSDFDEADKSLNEFIEKYQNSNLANIARIYAYRGNIEKSFEWLFKAFDHPDSTLLDILNSPDFRKMHHDPRWHDLIVKMKFPDSHWLVNNLP